jgi:ubiquinol-cytochrome c reductase cytochrome b subunit
MGWPDGALRIMPNWESHVWGHTISWNVLLPIQVLPLAMFSAVLLLPFVEAWVTGDKDDHHLLQRPRNAPTRTAFLAALMTVYGLFWAAGGNDIIATHMSMSINAITYFMRGAVFVLPPIVFVVVRRWCIGLQRADNERLLHGYESGVIMRSPDGGYTERHLPIGEAEAFTLASRDRDLVLVPAGDTDENGVPTPGTRGERARTRLNRAAYADNVQPPTPAEIAVARRHAEHERALEAGLDHPAEGHDFDDHRLRDADAVPLRGGQGDD